MVKLYFIGLLFNYFFLIIIIIIIKGIWNGMESRVLQPFRSFWLLALTLQPLQSCFSIPGGLFLSLLMQLFPWRNHSSMQSVDFHYWYHSSSRSLEEFQDRIWNKPFFPHGFLNAFWFCPWSYTLSHGLFVWLWSRAANWEEGCSLPNSQKTTWILGCLIWLTGCCSGS